MGETTGQIEGHIRNTRADLSANLSELEQKVKSATNWRHHFENNSGAFLAAAVGGGLLLSLIGSQRHRSLRASSAVPETARTSSSAGSSAGTSGHGPLNETIAEIKGALIGVAATQAKGFISKLVPGFEEQLVRSGTAPSAGAPR